jgi:hypothetical protein
MKTENGSSCGLMPAPDCVSVLRPAPGIVPRIIPNISRTTQGT